MSGFSKRGQYTTVDINNLPVHKITCRRSQKDNGTHQVVGVSPASGRRTVNDEFIERMAAYTLPVKSNKVFTYLRSPGFNPSISL